MDTNTDLGNVISRLVAERMTPEYVEKEVKARVDKLIEGAVDSALRTYSETGKAIEKAVEDALKVQKLDLPAYGDAVCAILKAQIELRVSDLVSGRLAEDMEELLSLAPKEIKLSKIAEEMCEQHRDEGYGEVITVIVERTEYGSTWIYLDEENAYDRSDKYRCAVRMLINKDGTVSSAAIEGKDPNKRVQWIGRSYGLEQKVRAYVACGTVIEIDEDDVYTSVGDY